MIRSSNFGQIAFSREMDGKRGDGEDGDKPKELNNMFSRNIIMAAATPPPRS